MRNIKRKYNHIGFFILYVLFPLFLLTIVFAEDTTAPVINTISAEPNTLNKGDLLEITANVTDDVFVETVLVEIEGINYSMGRIVNNNTVLFDDFESGDLSTNDWILSGVGNVWAIDSSDPSEGINHIRAEPSDLGGSVIETNISTIGFTNIDLGFYAKTLGLDIGDTFRADWYNGTNWINLLITHDEADDEFSDATDYKFFGYSLPDSADNKNNITIRLGCFAGGVNEVCEVDYVTVTKSIEPQKALFDDFESNDLSNWTTSGAGNAWVIDITDPYYGLYHLIAEPSDLGGSFIETNIETLGYKNIDFSFYAKTPNLDAGDTFQVDWYNGTEWTILLITHDEAEDEFADANGYKFFGFSLPVSADNKNNITIRLGCFAGGVNEVCEVDYVEVTKVPYDDDWEYTYDTTGLSSGLHNYIVYAYDSSGNIGNSMGDFTILSTPVSISIISPASGNITERKPSLDLSITGDISEVWVSLDNGKNVTYTYNDGLINFGKLDLIFADDFSGYTEGSDGSPIWENLPLFADAIIENETYMLFNETGIIDALSSINGFDETNYYMSSKVMVPSGYFGGAYLCPHYGDVNNKYEIALDFDWSSININKVVDGAWVNLAAEWTGNLNPPIAINKDDWYELGFRIQDDNITAYVNGQHAISVLDNDLNFTGLAIIAFDDLDTHKVFFDNISIYKDLPFGPHQLDIYYNGTNGSFYSSSVSFAVIGDTNAPVISNLETIELQENATISWNSDDMTTYTLYYDTSLNFTDNITNLDYSTTHSIELSDLSSGTLYYYNITLCNFEGYCINYGTYNFTTLAIPNTAPIITSYYPNMYDVNIIEPRNQTFNIAYTDQEGDSTIRWYVDGFEDATYFNQTEFIWVGNYSQEGSYNIGVIVSDNEFIDSNVWNLTINDVDITPPATIINLQNQSQGISWIYWTWTNPSDIDFFENIIYLDGINILNTSDNYYNATGLQSNTSYTITINTKDTSGNVNDTNVTSTAKTLENISEETEIIETTEPKDNSTNVSLKQDVTAVFNFDLNVSTINSSTVIVKDSNNSTVRGKIVYYPDSDTIIFSPYRFLEENETYTVIISSEIRLQNGSYLESDIVWNFTTELKDTDKDGIFDIYDLDDDNDNINDDVDYLKGIDASHIKTDIVGLTILVNDSLNISKDFNNPELVQFFVNGTLIIEFIFPFEQSKALDLTNITIQQNEYPLVGSLIINGFSYPNITKTFYLDNLSYYDGVCIKDADVDSIEDISNTCKENYETFVECPGSAGNYNCTIYGLMFNITGLNHSAVKQADDNSAPRIDLMSISYSGSSTVSVTLTVITDEEAQCRYDTSDKSFDSMSYSLGSGVHHSDSRSYSQDTSGTYYILCRDNFGNTMSSANSISFYADVQERSDGESSGGGGSGGDTGGGLLNITSCNENWICDGWDECKNGFQTRGCFDLNNCGTENQKPIEFQTCKNECEEIWQCDEWSVCSDDIRKRQCYDLNKCGTEEFKPSEYESCVFIAECYNLIQDNGESGIDCGGSCAPCETCYDRIQNQGEEGIDCGGPCRPCRTGDIATGRTIQVSPIYSPNSKNALVTLVVIVSLLFTFKESHKLRRLLKKKSKVLGHGNK